MSGVDSLIASIRAEEVVRLTRLGLSARRIANRLGLSPRTVQRYRARCGVALPAAPTLTTEQLERAQILLEDGAPLHDVARTIGASRKALAKRFPGHTWNRQQVADYANACRALHRMERTG